MSHEQNTIWFEAAFQNFSEAIETKNYALARDIIDDIFDKGFNREAVELGRILLAKQVKI